MNTRFYAVTLATIAFIFVSLPIHAAIIGTPDNSYSAASAVVLDPVTSLPHSDSMVIEDFESPFAQVETNFNIGRNGTGTMKASADSTTGELKAYTSADNRLTTEDTMPGVANPSNQNVRAEIGERIWINEPIPAAGLPVTLTLDVSGSAAMMAGSDSLAPITDIFQDIFASIIMLPGGDQTQLLDASKSTVDGDSMASTTVSLFFYLPSDTSFFDVIYSLNLVQTNYNYQGEIDYFNTAIASIDLPEGYTFSSESGHFLSAPPPSEPPPSSTSPPMPWLPLLLE